MPDRKLEYVYVTSVQHSGSTLIACLLDAHPEIASVGEFAVPHSPSLNCSCGVEVKDCPFWTWLAQEAKSHGIEFEIGKPDFNMLSVNGDNLWRRLFFHQFSSPLLTAAKDAWYRLSGVRKDSQKKLEKSITLARLICEKLDSRVFADSSKNPQQIRHLAKRKELSFKMIGLVRDGRAVMKSLIHREGYTPQQVVDAWTWGNKHLYRAARHIPSKNVHLIKLEELCNEPEKRIKEIFEFIGVDPNADLDFSVSNRHIIGNSMRKTFDGQIRPHDDSWRKVLTSEQIGYFNQKAGYLNRKLGYE